MKKKLFIFLCLITLLYQTSKAENMFFWGDASSTPQPLPPGNYWVSDTTGNIAHWLGACFQPTQLPSVSCANLPHAFYYQVAALTTTPNFVLIGFHCPITCSFTTGGAPTYQIWKTDQLFPTSIGIKFTVPASATTTVMFYYNLYQDSMINMNWPSTVSVLGLVGNYVFTVNGCVAAACGGTDYWQNQYQLKAGDQNAYLTPTAIAFLLGAVGNQIVTVNIGGK